MLGRQSRQHIAASTGEVGNRDQLSCQARVGPAQLGNGEGRARYGRLLAEVALEMDQGRARRAQLVTRRGAEGRHDLWPMARSAERNRRRSGACGLHGVTPAPR